MEIPEENKKNLYRALLGLIIILSLYFAARFFSEIKLYSTLGNVNVSTIALSGHGEVNAVPDIANISFTITKEAKTVKEAQEGVATVEKNTLDFLKNKGIADKDIKTENVSFYPKYDYNPACPGGYGDIGMPCRQKGPQIIGYEASESITVKIRNTDDAGAIIQGLGSIGVSNLSGPNFAIDDEDALKAQARKKAIDEAKMKAKVLSKDLGVHLGRIVDFSESGNSGPIYYSKTTSADSAPAPAKILKGENTINADVTITYEIR